MNKQISLEIMNEVHIKLSIFSHMHSNSDFDDSYAIQSILFEDLCYITNILKLVNDLDSIKYVLFRFNILF